jgi:hypothetical protein
VGLLIQSWLGPPREEREKAMFEALDERLRRVSAGIREISGCNAHRVSATEATDVIGEFWAGDSFEYGDLSKALRTRPLVGGRS